MGKSLKKKLRKHMMKAAIAMIIILLLFFLKIDIGKIIIILGLIFLGCICKIYKHFTALSIGFELVTPITIIFAYQIGIFFAISSAIFMVIISEFISGRMNSYSVSIQIIIYILISIIAGLFSGVAFIPLAITLIVIRNLLLWIVMVLFVGVDAFRATMATFPNIFINGFIINAVGLTIVNIL